MKYYALIVANQDYDDEAINDLDFPISDADSLYKVLTELYTFDPGNTVKLFNSNREDLINTLDSMSNIIGPNDNLLIFYAGHGYWDKGKDIGYWLLSDAKKNSPANWVTNSTIKDYIAGIKSNHTLLIADACFSGGIFKGRDAFSGAEKAITKLYAMSSRKAMTSGTLEVVPDKSIFTKYLLKNLLETDKKFISANELFNLFRPAVLNNSETVPQYGTVQNAGDEGGDFIFIKR